MSTFAQLQADIAAWLMRSDLEQIIPVFIRHGESRLNKRIRHRLMEQSATLTFSGTGVATLPTDFLEARSVSTTVAGRPVFLEYVEPDSAEWMFLHRPSVPKYYTLIAETIVTRPAVTQPAQLSYYARIQPLSVAAPTNWLLTRFPEVYLYAALIEGAVYLRDQELLSHYAQLLNDSTQGVLTDRHLARASQPELPPAQLAAETRDQMMKARG